jgi:hypothetical protein
VSPENRYISQVPNTWSVHPSRTSAKMSTTKAPPALPTIDDFNLFLEVVTHKDLRPTSPDEPREWGDSERLAELGSQALNNVITFHFFSRSPPIRAEEIRVNFHLLLWLSMVHHSLRRRGANIIQLRIRLTAGWISTNLNRSCVFLPARLTLYTTTARCVISLS